ncbi:MAG: flagellar export chaperone FlgN [Candidatus Cloacimonetes bacterium]|nr:flagellar export chaperone FlgN [Candidatus Cloacimonadota bacterium]
MENLINDFFKSWQIEIAAYQEVLICLTDQKKALIEWDIQQFQKISGQTATNISRAHRRTYARNDLLESLYLMMNLDLGTNNLKTLSKVFIEQEYAEKAEILFRSFSNTLRAIDKLSAENKELIKTGLELVGENLEMLADFLDRDKIYSHIGKMATQKRSPLLLNTLM